MAFVAYFDKNPPDFKPSDRQWNFSEDGNTAWFDESLETWMQGCRGTGIYPERREVVLILLQSPCAYRE